MRIYHPIALLLCVFALVSGARSQEVTLKQSPQAVVELFTSQGCASCPPADRLLTQLGQRDDVIALAYHVDYWDYAGWTDTFGHAAHSALQHAYTASWGKSRIYTPQIVVNGRHGVVGTHGVAVREALEAATLPLDVSLSLEDDGEVVSLHAEGRDQARSGIVWLVPYIGHAEVAVERGENSGHALSYTHIAGVRQVIGVWEPDTGVSLRIPLEEALGPDHDGAAILIQEKQGDLPGPLLGAASFSR